MFSGVSSGIIIGTVLPAGKVYSLLFQKAVKSSVVVLVNLKTPSKLKVSNIVLSDSGSEWPLSNK